MSRHNPIDWDREPLGKRIDREIADKLGSSLSAVQRERSRRGIPPLTNCGRKGINWDLEPLGVVADADLALMLDVSVQSVYQARNRRSIAAYTKRKRGNSWLNK